MKDKKTFIRKSAFPKSLSSLLKVLVTLLSLAYTKITEKTIAQILITQVAIKSSDPDKINFQIL